MLRAYVDYLGSAGMDKGMQEWTKEGECTGMDQNCVEKPHHHTVRFTETQATKAPTTPKDVHGQRDREAGGERTHLY